LVTLNTLFKGDVRARLRTLGGILERADHDIVCLQEVMYRHGVRLLERAAPALRYRAFTGVVLISGGLVVLSRWPIRRYRFVRYPPARPLRPELLMRKGIQLVTIAVPGGDLAVLNTHLSANRDDDWSAGNRYTLVQQGELRRLAEVVASIPSTVPLVVAGDLNLPRDSPVLAEFIAAAGLRDLRAGDSEPTYRPTPSWPAPPALDHVLVRGAPGRPLTGRSRLVFQEEVTLDGGRSVYLSDHYGIDADLDG
jgi:endonuclease/exonuclease/phosphatase family metal-dependent hydrolase